MRVLHLAKTKRESGLLIGVAYMIFGATKILEVAKIPLAKVLMEIEICRLRNKHRCVAQSTRWALIFLIASRIPCRRVGRRTCSVTQLMFERIALVNPQQLIDMPVVR